MTPTSFAGLINNFIGLINKVIPILVGLALVIFFWGLIQYIYESGDAHGHSRGRELIIWGLVALFVMVSVWGILALMKEALNL